jgi:YYY domain-containing protein
LVNPRLLLLVPFLIAALALGLRLQGIDWDAAPSGAGETTNYNFYHPDERSIYLRANTMYQTLTEAPGWQSTRNRDFPLDTPGLPSIKTFLDKDASPLNPHWFPLGSIIIYILVAVRGLILEPLMDQVRLEDMASTGRTIAAIVDAGSVLLLYFLGRRLFGTPVGILASLLLTFTVMNIQQTHFYRPDAFIILLALGTFWWALNVLERGRKRDHAFLGLMVGLSFSFRASGAPLLIPVLGTYGILVWRLWKGGGLPLRMSTRQVLPIALVAGGIALVTFAVLQPYAFLDYRKFFGDLGWETGVARTAGSVPYTVQYVGTARNGLYEIRQSAVWALGLPLGIVAWLGLLSSFVRGFFKRHTGELLLVAWALPLFLLISTFEVKFLRYIAPILPVLVLLGSRWMMTAYRELNPRSVILGRAVLAMIAFVVVATVWYGTAFVGIYNEVHPGAQASEWINANGERGDVVLTDNHWDEGFRDLGKFTVSQLPMYEGDSFTKVERVAGMVAGADYIMAYSNRPWGSIARLSERYEFSANYYQALFDGSLGFEMAQAFERYPSFAGVTFAHDPFTRATVTEPTTLPGVQTSGLTFNLGWADENVVDYDHPLVLVWENTGELSYDEIQAIMLGIGAPDRPEPAMLSPEAFDEQRAGGTFNEIFSEGGLNGVAPWLVWLLAIEVIAWATVPLVVRTLRWLPDRGVVLARPLGLLLVAWVVWLGASTGVWAFGRTSVILSILIVGAISGVIFWRNRALMQALVRRHWRYLVSVELLFIVAYLTFVMIRAANPDLWHPFRGGEKPMDLSYLTAVAKSVSFPPYDPWYAGGYINYYYFGFVPIAALMRLTGIVPTVAYNLAVPLLFALTFTGAFSVGYNLTEGLRQRIKVSVSARTTLAAAVVTALLVTVLGNLDGAAQLLQATGRTLGGNDFGNFDFWRSSRLMPGQIAITEFPFWSFLFADLHAHMISLFVQVTVIGLAVNLVLGARSPVGWRTRLPGLAWLAFGVGSFAAINTWDVPAYGLLAIGTLAIVWLVGRRQPLTGSLVGKYAIVLGLFGVLLYALFLPFHQSYESVFDGTFFSRWRTVAWHYMAVHGLLFFLTGSWLVVEATRRFPAWRRLFTVRWPDSPRALLSSRLLTWVLAVGVAGLGSAVWISVPKLHQWTTVAALAIVMALALAVAASWLARAVTRETPVQLLLLGMLVLALGIGAGVDFVTAERDIDRMNTVFKFYLNAWVLYSIVGGVGLWHLWATGALRWRGLGGWRYAKTPWIALLVLLVLSTAIFPVLGTRTRIGDRFDNSLSLTLEGDAFQQVTTYHDPGPGNDGQDPNARYALASDAEALEYLRDNIQGTPVFLEGVTTQYRWTPRVSLYTGLPVVVGWEWHQIQQRGAGGAEPARVRARIADVERMYRTTNVGEFTRMIDKYAVEYVYLGPTERLYFDERGIAKLDELVGTLFEVYYANDEVTVYRVLPPGGRPA